MLVMNVSLGSFFLGYNMYLINSLDLTINDYYFNIDYNTDSLKKIEKLTNDDNFVNSEKELGEVNSKLRERVSESFKLLFSKIQ